MSVFIPEILLRDYVSLFQYEIKTSVLESQDHITAEITATSYSASYTEVNVSSATWIVNGYQNYYMLMGTQVIRIISNTATKLVLTRVCVPVSTNKFRIQKNNLLMDSLGRFHRTGEFDLLREAQTLFLKTDPIKVKFGMNIATADFPCVHIILPQEEQTNQSLGASPDSFEDTDGGVAEVDESYFRVRYSLMILAANADLVILIYQVLKYMFLRYLIVLELDGFETIKIGGNDLITEQNMIPQNVYSRNINLDFLYTTQTINKITLAAANSLVVDKTKIELYNQEGEVYE